MFTSVGPCGHFISATEQHFSLSFFFFLRIKTRLTNDKDPVFFTNSDV